VIIRPAIASFSPLALSGARRMPFFVGAETSSALPRLATEFIF